MVESTELASPYWSSSTFFITDAVFGVEKKAQPIPDSDNMIIIIARLLFSRVKANAKRLDKHIAIPKADSLPGEYLSDNLPATGDKRVINTGDATKIRPAPFEL